MPSGNKSLSEPIWPNSLTPYRVTRSKLICSRYYIGSYVTQMLSLKDAQFGARLVFKFMGSDPARQGSKQWRLNISLCYNGIFFYSVVIKHSGCTGNSTKFMAFSMHCNDVTCHNVSNLIENWPLLVFVRESTDDQWISLKRASSSDSVSMSWRSFQYHAVSTNMMIFSKGSLALTNWKYHGKLTGYDLQDFSTSLPCNGHSNLYVLIDCILRSARKRVVKS